MRILVVDDSAVQGETLDRLLTLKGHQCDYAANGEAALGSMSVHRYDGLIVDQRMPPGMSGLELIRQVRAMLGYEAVPVMLVTGLELDALRDEARTLGGVTLAQKPYTLEQIEDALSGRGAS